VFDLIIRDQQEVALNDVFFSPENKQQLVQLLKEHQYLEELQRYNLHVDNKILLHGYSGCGKTTTAKAMANALGKSLVIMNLSTLVSSKLGETAQNVKFIFDKANREKAVLFLDEFDQVGKMRSSEDKDSGSGEMRRLVNTIIQLIDSLPAHTLLIAATNHYDIIDTALLRRFQLKLKYEMPSEAELDAYYDKILVPFPPHMQQLPRRYDISYAEAKDYVHTAMKRLIIEELESRVLV
jgi:SpoVK/Ycf46/Vps4 family AAA+-type ATPase